MNKHAKKHEHPHQHQHPPARKGLKRHHMIILAGVLLMLAAMAMYVLSLDESIAPGNGNQPPVPAAPPAE